MSCRISSCLSLVRKYHCSPHLHQSWFNHEENLAKSLDPLLPASMLNRFKSLIPLTEFKLRQQNLVNLVHQYTKSNNRTHFKENLLAISSAKKMFQADTLIPTFNFKQNSDFEYLTGLNGRESSDCVLIILSQETKFESFLFVPKRSDNEKNWEGPGLYAPTYQIHLNHVSDCMMNLEDISEYLDTHKKCNLFVTKYGQTLPLLQKFIQNHSSTNLGDAMSFSSHHSLTPLNLSEFIDRLKLIKSSNEMNCMRRACSIGAYAMKNTIKWSQEQSVNNLKKFGVEAVNESQISSKFDYECRLNGAQNLAYPSVCAGDDRAVIIHYGANNKFVNANQWILMDAGCQDLEGYNSDITRCWGMNKIANNSKARLTNALYQALCEVQNQLITLISERPEEISLNDLFQFMCHFLSQVISEFGLSADSSKQAILLADHFCPHHVSHYLGLDVHDTPTVSRDVKLRKGICFTIEPGLYFRPDDPNVKNEFKGIGLRVEDNFLINENGVLENLTKNCPLRFNN